MIKRKLVVRGAKMHGRLKCFTYYLNGSNGYLKRAKKVIKDNEAYSTKNDKMDLAQPGVNINNFY